VRSGRELMVAYCLVVWRQGITVGWRRWPTGHIGVDRTLPALVTACQFDALVIRAHMRGPAPLNNAFVFMDGQAALGLARRQSGAYPWWTLPEGQVAFWRPLSALTHWIDFALWPDAPQVMHGQSLLWLGPLAA